MPTVYPPTLKAIAGAKTGIAPVNLLDVQDVNGNLYFWSDRACNAPIVITGEIDASAFAPVPPDVAQSLTWSLPTAVTTGPFTSGIANGSVSASADGTAHITMTFAGPLGNWGWFAKWTGFAIPPLPAGAVIDQIIPVIKASGTGSGASAGAWAGPGSDITQVGPSGSNLRIPTDGEFDGQYSAALSIGNTVAAIGSCAFGARLFQTLSSTFEQELDVSFVGLAVYYHVSSGGSPGGGVSGTKGISSAPYQQWLLQVPSFTFHRSLVTDIGSFVIQNLSGDTLTRDPERILRTSTLEGAMFVYRLWEPTAEAALIEVHGTLTVEDAGTDTMTLKGSQLINPSQDDTPLEIFCETCQIDWAGRRCGSTQPTECNYSFQSCQVIERPMLILNNFEKNFGNADANVAVKVINRRRRI